MAEGVTDYYGALLVRRAGLTSTPEYLDMLSGSIEAVQTRPGRRVQSAEMASFDTWIKQYRPDENSANTSIDYYDKGATIAFLLDARIRKASGGARTLDDAMRLAYKRYSGAKGFTPEEFQKAMSETAGADLSPWFAQVLTTTEELDFTEALEWFGLRFTPVDPRGQRPTTGPGDPQRQRPAGRDRRASQHPGLRGRPQRGRRDPGRGRPARPRRRPGGAAGPVPRRRHGAAAGGPAGSPDDDCR